MVAAAVASIFSRQLACPAAKPGLRFPLALPAFSLTPFRTFTNTRAPRADIDDDLPRPKMGSGSLTSSSIFADEEDMQTFEPPSTKGAKPKSPHLDAAGKPLKPKDKGAKKKTSTEFDISDAIPLEQRDREAMMATLLPFPNRTARWQRKMVIRAIQKRGRLTLEETRLRTEREHLCKSHFFKTSVKKLVPLARQIRGKSVEEALLQMRFSPKKAAKDVLKHLEYARDQATVLAGMGLGKVNGEVGEEWKPVTIVTKDKKKRVVEDPTTMYVAQAWVNRGPFGMEPDFRGLGRVFVMKPPHTGLTVLLKEEKTLIREAREREEKSSRQREKKVWTQLPDRPVTWQRQYYTW